MKPPAAPSPHSLPCRLDGKRDPVPEERDVQIRAEQETEEELLQGRPVRSARGAFSHWVGVVGALAETIGSRGSAASSNSLRETFAAGVITFLPVPQTGEYLKQVNPAGRVDASRIPPRLPRSRPESLKTSGVLNYFVGPANPRLLPSSLGFCCSQPLTRFWHFEVRNVLMKETPDNLDPSLPCFDVGAT